MIQLPEPMIADAAWWDEQYAAGRAQNWSVWGDAELIRTVAFRLTPGGHVLMAACGTAIGARAIAATRPDLKWTFCDYSVEALAAAKLLIPTGKFVLWDLNQEPWPFEDLTFDSVIVSEVLEHAAHPAAMIKEAARCAVQRFYTMPISIKLLSPVHRWQFETVDPWRHVPGNLRTAALRDGALLLVESTPL